MVSQSPLCLVFQSKHIFLFSDVIRCRYRIESSDRVYKKGCMTTHCELGLSGCLQVWRGCWWNHSCLFHDLYLLEHVTLTKQAQNKLAAAQTKMERSMLNITYKDRRTNIWVRERTTVRYNQQRDKKEMVHGRALQPPQRRQMNLECHHLETI